MRLNLKVADEKTSNDKSQEAINVKQGCYTHASICADICKRR